MASKTRQAPSHRQPPSSTRPGAEKISSFMELPSIEKSRGTRRVPQLAVCLIYLMPAATMQSKTRVSTTNTAATHLVPRASLASMLLALERLI